MAMFNHLHGARKFLHFWLLPLIICSEISLAEEQPGWRELNAGNTRIKSDKQEAPAETAVEQQLDIPEGHYDPGEGQIDGAFGVSFDEPIPDSLIETEAGWLVSPHTPKEPAYTSKLGPLSIRALHIAPSLQPKQLKSQKVTYTAFVDFDGKPMAIETSSFHNANEVIEVIKRKYGEPDEINDSTISYVRGKHWLHIYQAAGDKAQLRYEVPDSFTSYIKERNGSLANKYHRKAFDRLSPEESKIVQLAAELGEFRNDNSVIFGLPLDKRIGFKATPNEFVSISAPSPLSAFSDGDYQVMVSPDLVPIAVRYQLQGNDRTIAARKFELETAMDLAFGGFIKQTPKHSVLSFGRNAYSLLVRQGKFQFTVHDREENNRRRAREKQARLAKAAAEKERKRLEELEKQRLAFEAEQRAIAARQKEIEEEKAF